MTINNAPLADRLIALLLISSLLFPAFIPMNALAQAQADSPENASDPGGDPVGEGNGEGTSSAPDADGDGESDAAEAEASAAAAAEVSSAASITGVEVSVGTVDTTANANAKGGASVSINGVTMSVDQAMEAIGAIADAQVQGLSPAAAPGAVGIDVNATLEAHSQGYPAVVGSASGVTGSVAEVTAAETGVAVGREATAALTDQQFNDRFAATAPAPNINQALAVAAAHPSLFSPVSLTNQQPALSISFSNISISPSPIGGTPTSQTFSQDNTPVPSNSFSLGDFTPGLTNDPGESYDPGSFAEQYAEYGRGQAVGMAQARMDAAENSRPTVGIAALNESVMALNQAIDARVEAERATISALMDPSTINQAIAVVSQSKAQDLESLADQMAEAQAKNDEAQITSLSQQIDTLSDRHDRALEDARSSIAGAQAQLSIAATAARTAVNEALGVVAPPVDPTAFFENPWSSTPNTQNALNATANALTDFLGIPPAIAEWAAIAINALPASNFATKAQDTLSTLEQGLINMGVNPDIASKPTALGNFALGMVPGVHAAANLNNAINFNHMAKEVGPEDKNYNAYNELSNISLTKATVAAAIDVISFGAAKGLQSLNSQMAQTAAAQLAGTSRTSLSGTISGPASGRLGMSVPESVSVAPGSRTAVGTPTTGVTTGTMGGRTPETTLSYNPQTNTVTARTEMTARSTYEGRISYSNPSSRAIDQTTANPGKLADDLTTAPTPVNSAPATVNSVGRQPTVSTQPSAPTGVRDTGRTTATVAKVSTNAVVAVVTAFNAVAISPANLARAADDIVDSMRAGITRSADDLGPSSRTVSVAENPSRVNVTPAVETPAPRSTAATPVTAPAQEPTQVTPPPAQAEPTDVNAPQQTAEPAEAPAVNTSPQTAEPTVAPETGPATYTGIENAVRADDGLVSKIGNGLSNIFGELLGVKPAASEPLGAAQNNPTNIRSSADNGWVGEVAPQRSQAFEAFTTPEYGYRAATKIQQSYQARGIDTVRERIQTATPLSENPIQPQYIQRVAAHMGIGPDTPFDINNRELAIKYLEAVTVEEVGTGHFTRQQVEAGYDLATRGAQQTVVAGQVVTPAPAATAPARGILATFFAMTDTVQNPQALTERIFDAVLEETVRATPAPTVQPAVARAEDPQFRAHTSLKGVDERVTNILRAAAEDFPLRVAFFSGKRSSGGHGKGVAGDVVIYDHAGNPIAAYQTPQTANIYAMFALKVREAQMRMYPELNDNLVWGGAWQGMAKGGGGTRYGAADWMDFRIGYSGQNTMNAFAWPDPARPGSGGWQTGFEHYTEGDFLGIGSRSITPEDYAKLEGFTLTPEQIQIQKDIALKGGPQGPFNAGLLGHKNIASRPAVTTPTVAAETPAEVPSVTPTATADVVPSGTLGQSPVSETPSFTPSRTSDSTGGGQVTIGDQPPTVVGSVDPSNSRTGLFGRLSRFGVATLAFLTSTIQTAIGQPEDEPAVTTTTELPTVTEPANDNGQPPATAGLPTGGLPPGQVTGPINTYPIGNTIDSTGTSTSETVHVAIQIDGNTGDIYFDVEGVHVNGEYYDQSYEHEPDDPEGQAVEDLQTPSIILDDKNSSVVYSDGTYAPVVINGIWYESPDDPDYVYTVEFYQDGQVIEIDDNKNVLPGNALTGFLNALFDNTRTFYLEDIEIVTRALIDPDEKVPADEYYAYRIYLRNGDIRGTTVPYYTSYHFLDQRFSEIGFEGEVLRLISSSIEIPVAKAGFVSGIANTLKEVGLTVIDLFQDDESGSGPIMTDFGELVPSDDGVITMNDIKTATVLFEVDAECPLVPGLAVPYLYEIIIAKEAVSGATSDQAFRAIRCGGGDKDAYVEQIANHLESFDGVGGIDRQKLSDIIRFGSFEDVDLSRLMEEEAEPSVDDSVPAIESEVEENTDDETFKPNLTNEITFEVKAVDGNGQVLSDWTTAGKIEVGSGVQLYFRWSGTDYQQCLPFLNDNGNYALTVSNRAMVTGNTESEGYNVSERSAVYRLECGGQRNNEFGVDAREIEVVVD